jgi:hypothetical protein
MDTKQAIMIASIALLLEFTGQNAIAADSPGSHPIYRCELNGGIVFSDRPCGPDTQTVQVAVPASNSYHDETYDRRSTRASTKQQSHVVRIPRDGDSIAQEQLRAKLRCQRLTDQLETIEYKLRAGYTAQQGERLRERQRELERKRRTERCK